MKGSFFFEDSDPVYDKMLFSHEQGNTHEDLDHIENTINCSYSIKDEDNEQYVG